ncbi:hypothetical protein N9632_00320 [bacterium]|nr:hypothetical protein [bacterium]
MNKLALCGVGLLMLQACSDAQKSSEVTAAYVPSSAYSSMSCNNLRSEDLRLRRSVSEMTGAVDKEYKQDKTMEAVAWILFWPAALAMNGNDAEAAKLSQAKGEAEAIRATMISKNCRM